MELKEFVTESIKQIVDGVNDAIPYAAENGSRINPKRQVFYTNNVGTRSDPKDGASIEAIEFDVAITITEGTQTKAGIGILTGLVGLGAQGQSEATNTSLTRLRFVVPLVLPTTPNPEADA